MQKAVIIDDERAIFKQILDLENNEIQLKASQNSFPVVDLYSIYKSINANTYTSRDGVKVDPSFPKGNFYSSDGIYATAFGQAVIANEFIFMINFYYNAKIPYVDSRQFLKKSTTA